MRLWAGIIGISLALPAWGCGGQAEDEAALGVAEPGFDGPLGKADSTEGEVELKVTLRPEQISRAKKKFGLKTSVAATRDVWFYDTPELSLFEGGLILRARDKHGEPDDSTVKLRPMLPEDVDASWFELSGFKCEEDRSVTKSVSSCSLTVIQDEGEIGDVADGVRDIDKLFSSDQEALIDGYASVVVDFPGLSLLGPVDAKVWKVTPSGFDQKLTMELWELPDSTRLLEVSLRASPAKADATLTALVDYLAARGFDTSEQQETKTRAALEFFAGAAQ